MKKEMILFVIAIISLSVVLGGCLPGTQVEPVKEEIEAIKEKDWTAQHDWICCCPAEQDCSVGNEKCDVYNAQKCPAADPYPCGDGENPGACQVCCKNTISGNCELRPEGKEKKQIGTTFTRCKGIYEPCPGGCSTSANAGVKTATA
ncbi:hypothetical protein JXB41_08855 [Candidatus Woesearchaeota archaeon]|nr:hypothetical protein [Candidatus Woesearchaeota archaeon]